VLGSAMVRQVRVTTSLDGWRRPTEIGDRQSVLQLRVHGSERGDAKRGGGRRWVSNAQVVRPLVPRRSNSDHNRVDIERFELGLDHHEY